MKKYSNKGETLLEQLISIAIIGILLVIFIPLFVNFLIIINSFGTRTKNFLDASDKVNAVVLNNSTNNVIIQSNQIIKLTIYPVDGINSITTSDISGKIITFDTSGSNKTILSTFLPD